MQDKREQWKLTMFRISTNREKNRCVVGGVAGTSILTAGYANGGLSTRAATGPTNSNASGKGQLKSGVGFRPVECKLRDLLAQE